MKRREEGHARRRMSVRCTDTRKEMERKTENHVELDCGRKKTKTTPATPDDGKSVRRREEILRG